MSMAERLRLVVFLFALPILALVLASSVSSGASEAEQQVRSLMRGVATFTVALGLSGAALTIVAGRAARRSRALLIRIYGPAMSWARTAVIAFVVLQVLMLVSIAAFLEVVLFEGVYGFLVMPVAIMAALGIIYRSGIAYTVDRLPLYPTRIADAAPDSPLGQFIEGVARAVGVSAPRMVVVGLERDFLITESASHLVTNPQGRTLYLSLPLCRLLRRLELAALIARELGGFKGMSGQFVQTVLPVHSAVEERLNMVQSLGRGARWTWLITMPEAAVFSFVRHAFSGAVRTATQERELDADQTVASATWAQSLASALLKQDMFAAVWADVLTKTKRTINERGLAPDVNLSARFAALVRERATPDAFREAGERLRAVQSRHDECPPLAVRLAALGVSLDDVQAAVLAVAPDDAAIDLIDGYEALELELSRDYPLDMFLELAEIGKMWDQLIDLSNKPGAKRQWPWGRR